ncbi:uncharacterized protein PADG_11154 [Paracoccidioides brasiliensis Pb18]|uniref:Amine oxidase n=1 Tax=Paracoccidioides brasiliensis (strain Pb18) TaxID=502780 RepID=A0A0A0HVW6_PARBD|nr:uncharacterized protein PADG_11154 [Paracoccidioides brasiliensis Pb18]KGM92697.1 hypothetical protein PADG_11154 [Paracoccidioides brasiliensis Pb18]
MTPFEGGALILFPTLTSPHISKRTIPATHFREVRVDLASGERLDESKLIGKRLYIDGTLINACEKACLADRGEQDVINRLELPENAAVVVEAWTYGTDRMRDMSKRLVMVRVKKFDRSKIHDTSEYHSDLVSDNYRTGNAVVTRSRILVLRAVVTGRFSPLQDPVAPGVLTPYHQHLFSLRIDPTIDGYENTHVVEDSIPMPLNNPEIHNSFGFGYITYPNNRPSRKRIGHGHHQAMGPSDISLSHIIRRCCSRTRCHYTPRDRSFARTRPGFLDTVIGSCTVPAIIRSSCLVGFGIASWIKYHASDESAANVRNQDIVLWTFGTTHNSRIEDWPVMPAEKMLVSLKPVKFFTGNLVVDVPISTQEQNMRVLVDVGAQKCCAPDGVEGEKAGKG